MKLVDITYHRRADTIVSWVHAPEIGSEIAIRVLRVSGERCTLMHTPSPSTLQGIMFMTAGHASRVAPALGTPVVRGKSRTAGTEHNRYEPVLWHRYTTKFRTKVYRLQYRAGFGSYAHGTRSM